MLNENQKKLLMEKRNNYPSSEDAYEEVETLDAILDVQLNLIELSKQADDKSRELFKLQLCDLERQIAGLQVILLYYCDIMSKEIKYNKEFIKPLNLLSLLYK